MTFERLAHFVTGARCEPTPGGVAIRVVLGIVCTTVVVGLMLVFLGAAAGNANSVAEFKAVFLPCTMMYAIYLTATVFVWRGGRTQAAQYLAWLPCLLLAAAGGLSFAWGMVQ
ncbi:MAG: hypothetical protein ACM3SS_17415 [Rhodospirillaceae bacterium]